MPKARTPDSTQSTQNDTTAGPTQAAENESANPPAPPTPPKEDRIVTLPNGETWTIPKDRLVDHPDGAIACPSLEAVHLFSVAVGQNILGELSAAMNRDRAEGPEERFGKAAYAAGCSFILPDAPIELVSQILDQKDGLGTIDIVHLEMPNGQVVGAFLPVVIADSSNDSEKQQ